MTKKKIVSCLCFAVILLGCSRVNQNGPESIIWNGVSEDETASFPFGNGEVAGNVWAEKDGIYMYLARNDCFSELGRLLKTGELKLSIDSCMLNNDCVQKLDLENGIIEITSPKLNIKVFADSQFPVIWIHGHLNTPSNVTIEPIIWRDSPHMIAEGEKHSAYNLHRYPGDFPFPESADKVFNFNDCAGFFHHNDTSTYEFTLKNNHLTSIGVQDPISNRTFGAMFQGSNLVQTEEGILKSTTPVSEFTVKVAVTSYPDCSPEDWKAKTFSVFSESDEPDNAEIRTKAYWNEIWERSYLRISTPDTVTGKKITDFYNCQRWITLCAGKSFYPLKFNGSLFTPSPEKAKDDTDFSPDYRPWGECFWWQNTRLPYFPMLKTGDWETIRGLVAFYDSLMPAFKEQARVYYGTEGAIIPETITQFGTFAASDYYIGNEEIGAANMYTRHIFQDPLELIHMMMDCYRYSGDEKFLRDEIIPMSEEFLDFFISYAKIDSLGKMRLRNTQSLETYWYGVENDLPSIAGLHTVVKDFTTLSDTLISASLAEKIDYLKKFLPDIPVVTDEQGNKMFSPAEKFDPKTCNAENPEMMMIFPFELCNFTSEDIDIGRRSFENRKFKRYKGWAPDGQLAARLGLTDEAKKDLLLKMEGQNKAFRFPGYFGPYDWIPDQDHGGNFMITLQDMVMQAYDGKVYLLPAFPKDWNVQFRMAVPGNAYVWGNYVGGKWTDKPMSDKKNIEIVF